MQHPPLRGVARRAEEKKYGLTIVDPLKRKLQMQKAFSLRETFFSSYPLAENKSFRSRL